MTTISIARNHFNTPQTIGLKRFFQKLGTSVSSLVPNFVRSATTPSDVRQKDHESYLQSESNKLFRNAQLAQWDADGNGATGGFNHNRSVRYAKDKMSQFIELFQSLVGNTPPAQKIEAGWLSDIIQMSPEQRSAYMNAFKEAVQTSLDSIGDAFSMSATPAYTMAPAYARSAPALKAA